MAEITKIEWCDSTFNPWTGCTKISPACDHCYAEGWAKRSGAVKWGNHPRRRTTQANWRKPLKWQRQAATFRAKHGRRRRVFCASLADVFDNQVDPQWRADLFAMIRATPDLVWLLLTKRPQNIVSMSEAAGGLPPNVAIGTTIEDQPRANINVPALLRAKAALRPLFAFLSCEPMLGKIDLTQVLWEKDFYVSGANHYVDVLSGGFWSPKPMFRSAQPGEDKRFFTNHSDMRPGMVIDQVIVGGESGHHARPMQHEWAISLRDQCAAANTSYFFKQWGEYQPTSDANGPYMMKATSKQAAGRLLDGVEHNGFPEVAL